MKVAIIGAGLIGKERIQAVQHIANHCGDVSISSVYDPNPQTRAIVQDKFNVSTVSNLDDAFHDNPDWVFVATPHDAILEPIKKAFEIGANVLVEKPLGRNSKECDNILCYKPEHLCLYVGFNYRFFTGISALLKDCEEQKFGKIISVNMILGHGNSPGMEKSWKLDPIQCGGGCLIDPGVHLLDLILQISGNTPEIKSIQTWKGFWNTGIEEEAHILLTNNNGSIFNLQISLNKWRSTFRIEVNGTEGYGIVEGRGRSYGPQSYRTGVRWGWQSGKSQIDSETIVVDNDQCNDSFVKETESILKPSLLPRPCTDQEARDVMYLLDKCRNI
jgi:predicted dehydrogenase